MLFGLSARALFGSVIKCRFIRRYVIVWMRSAINMDTHFRWAYNTQTRHCTVNGKFGNVAVVVRSHIWNVMLFSFIFFYFFYSFLILHMCQQWNGPNATHTCNMNTLGRVAGMHTLDTCDRRYTRHDTSDNVFYSIRKMPIELAIGPMVDMKCI